MKQSRAIIPSNVFSSFKNLGVNLVKLILILLLSNEHLDGQILELDNSVFTPNEIHAISFSAPTFADIDGDGDFDLFIASSSLSNIYFFRNDGNKYEPKFVRDDNLLSYVNDKEYENSPAYITFADLDNDGDLDLILGTFKGLQYYKNIGDKYFPIFFKIDNFFFEINKYLGNDAKPTFVDIDNDGDLDLFCGIGESLLGGPRAGTIIGFRNIGRKFYPKFVLDRGLTKDLPDIGLNAFPVFIDIDNDGDYDLLLGRDNNTLVYFQNSGTKKDPHWQRNDLLFSSVEKKSLWKIPTFVDVDNDGDYDLVYGTADGELYFYRNIGTKKRPRFRYESDMFTPIRITGGAPSVFFADYDGDGDLDFISGDWKGLFQFFRNYGNPYKAKFRKAYAPFSKIDVGAYSTPVFVDIDDDGDFDIVSGALDGKIYCFLYTKNGYVENKEIFKNIHVQEKSAPAFVDIDNDGDLDLLVCGRESKQARFYINNGKNNFILANEYIKNIKFPLDARPHFGDFDLDGDFDLIIGSFDGKLIYYENTGNKFRPFWELNNSIFNEIKVQQNSSPGIADLNSDGKADLIVGEYDGNFFFYKNNMKTYFVNFYFRPHQNGMIKEKNESVYYLFDKKYSIEFEITGGRDIFNPFKSEFVLITLFNVEGEKIGEPYAGFLRPGKQKIEIDLDKYNLPKSVYNYTIQISNGEFFSGKLFYY